MVSLCVFEGGEVDHSIFDSRIETGFVVGNDISMKNKLITKLNRSKKICVQKLYCTLNVFKVKCFIKCSLILHYITLNIAV